MDRYPTSLLGFLRAPARPVGEDFRANPRHESGALARIAWTEGPRDRTARADLVDVGRLGAALITADPPPVRARVRVRLIGPTPTPWIEAEVLAIEPVGGGRNRVRLTFREPCATLFLKSAIFRPVDPDPTESG